MFTSGDLTATVWPVATPLDSTTQVGSRGDRRGQGEGATFWAPTQCVLTGTPVGTGQMALGEMNS